MDDHASIDGVIQVAAAVLLPNPQEIQRIIWLK
jgi:hypothetical protein